MGIDVAEDVDPIYGSCVACSPLPLLYVEIVLFIFGRGTEWKYAVWREKKAIRKRGNGECLHEKGIYVVDM